jgi:hypothetical protein
MSSGLPADAAMINEMNSIFVSRVCFATEIALTFTLQSELIDHNLPSAFDANNLSSASPQQAANSSSSQEASTTIAVSLSHLLSETILTFAGHTRRLDQHWRLWHATKRCSRRYGLQLHRHCVS